MREFTYRVEDDRHPSPVLRRARVRDEHEAVKLASRILSETYHHLGVELWHQDQKLYAVQRPESRQAQP